MSLCHVPCVFVSSLLLVSRLVLFCPCLVSKSRLCWNSPFACFYSLALLYFTLSLQCSYSILADSCAGLATVCLSSTRIVLLLVISHWCRLLFVPTKCLLPDIDHSRLLRDDCRCSTTIFDSAPSLRLVCLKLVFEHFVRGIGRGTRRSAAIGFSVPAGSGS